MSLKRRVFFYVKRTDQNCPQRHFQEVRGNRALHSIQSTEISLHLKVRELTCYCESCLYEEYDACSNKAYVTNWEERELEREAGHGRQMPTRAVVNEQWESLKDLACKASTVAIASGDAQREYYLLKVTSDGTEVLQNVTTDAWENTFPPGAEVVRGSFYLAEDNAQRAYTLDEEKEAIVYAATIRFICSDFAIKHINGKDCSFVSEEQHLDILDALQGF